MHWCVALEMSRTHRLLRCDRFRPSHELGPVFIWIFRYCQTAAGTVRTALNLDFLPRSRSYERVYHVLVNHALQMTIQLTSNREYNAMLLQFSDPDGLGCESRRPFLFDPIFLLFRCVRLLGLLVDAFLQKCVSVNVPCLDRRSTVPYLCTVFERGTRCAQSYISNCHHQRIPTSTHIMLAAYSHIEKVASARVVSDRIEWYSLFRISSCQTRRDRTSP